MRGLAIACTLATASCFSPTVQPGGACTDAGLCPAPLVCDHAIEICVEPGGVDAPPCVPAAEICDGLDQDCDDRTDEDFAVGEGCVVGVGACAVDGTQICNSAATGVECMATGTAPNTEVCGDGIDQDCDTVDPPCPINDGPGGAIDVSAGGTFTGELATAHDDVSGSCGTDGGRDLYYEITVPNDEVIYVDSFGSDFDVVLRGFEGPCADNLGPEIACLDDECGAQAQGAGLIGAGTSCLVVDQGRGDTETHGHVEIRVIRGRRPGNALEAAAGTLLGTTAGESDLATPICEGDSDTAPDVGYYFTVCAGDMVTVTADTCDNTPYDSWLSIRTGSGRTGPELACLDDGCGPDFDDAQISQEVSGPGLFWIIVDGWGDDAGDYQLDYSIQ
jgi:hypothetical protein